MLTRSSVLARIRARLARLFPALDCHTLTARLNFTPSPVLRDIDAYLGNMERGK